MSTKKKKKKKQPNPLSNTIPWILHRGKQESRDLMENKEMGPFIPLPNY